MNDTERIKRLVMCPTCKIKYTKALYDWQYIYCNDCGTYFEKHTGNLIKHKDNPQSLSKNYWKTDSELGIDVLRPVESDGSEPSKN